MKSKLNLREMIALGFMAFALFLGAGNIISPPFIGIQAGSNVWAAAAGFLLTGVGLPVLAIIALGRAGGNLGNIISPVGHVAGNRLIIACYQPVFGDRGVLFLAVLIAGLHCHDNWADMLLCELFQYTDSLQL